MSYHFRRSGHKYNAQPTRDKDGRFFASKAEFDRYQELKLLERAGRIRDLQTQVAFELVAGIKHVVDFTYYEKHKDGSEEFIVEDKKGYRTEVWKLKRKLFEHCHPGIRYRVS